MPKPTKLETLKQQIRKAYIAGNYTLAEKLQKELDYFNYGLK